MKKSNLMQAAILIAAVIGLSGCDSIRDTLGLTRHVPDETQVTARPPLTLPPDYDLRPPGTDTGVSGAHEAGMSAPKNSDGTPTTPEAHSKEEKGFFGSIFGIFGGSDSSAPKPAPSSAPEGTTSQQINGVPTAPVPDASMPPAPAPAPAPAASKPEEKGFFDRLLDIF